MSDQELTAEDVERKRREEPADDFASTTRPSR
jgi:hypothetical protein